MINKTLYSNNLHFYNFHC